MSRERLKRSRCKLNTKVGRYSYVTVGTYRRPENAARFALRSTSTRRGEKDDDTRYRGLPDSGIVEINRAVSGRQLQKVTTYVLSRNHKRWRNQMHIDCRVYMFPWCRATIKLGNKYQYQGQLQRVPNTYIRNYAHNSDIVGQETVV